MLKGRAQKKYDIPTGTYDMTDQEKHGFAAKGVLSLPDFALSTNSIHT